jgi:heme exporter protein C
MRKWFGLLAIVTAALFAYAPISIAHAPYESTMGLVQKIFYFHVPSWMAMFAAIAVCGVASAIHIFKTRPAADRVAVAAAELAVLFGLMGLVTGPLWGRKAWGVWWQWDARLTMALLLELVFVSYLLVREYGGPGSDKLAAAVGLFGTAVSPFVYFSVNIWRTVHPLNTVVPTLKGSMMRPFALSSVAFLLLFVVLLALRVSLGRQQATLDELYMSEDL